MTHRPPRPDVIGETLAKVRELLRNNVDQDAVVLTAPEVRALALEAERKAIATICAKSQEVTSFEQTRGYAFAVGFVEGLNGGGHSCLLDGDKP